tara:strand:+ start:386 stop:1516 length:1131 start_codon:yes stop_codon:yes gene_type:complete
MVGFKHKNTKKIVINSKKTTTLDGKHSDMMNEFNNNNNVLIPSLENEKEELKEKLRVNNENPTLKLEEILDIKEQIKTIRNKIKDSKRKEKNYLLTNSNLIFDYFEEKKKISEGTNEIKRLDKFFNINKQNTKVSENKNNVQQYLVNVDDTFLNVDSFINHTDICKSCNKGELIPVDHEGILICNNCHISVKYLVDNEKSSYKEPPKELCFYAYKRINHFREILAQFQAKETTQIPDEVLLNIKLQIKKERIELSQITNKKAKEILKKLGYNKYYEHIPFIKDKMGIKPPIMSPELEETLCNLFMEIQAPYAKYCPDDRVNFLNYYYTVYKLCELLNQVQFLEFFPMLKDREKRIEQDEIWKKICYELDWEFIPTI